MRRLNTLSLGTRHERGMTLIELMVALVIMGMLMVSAGPFFGDYVTNSRLREGGNTVLTEALMAQSEAIKRNTTIRLSTDGATVRALDMTDPLAPVVLRERTLAGNVSAATATLDFGSEGRPVPFGTAGSINLSMAGVTCSSDLRCPGLRVDAGGAIRLCGNQLVCV
jgi:type IV fimbrial biogenesis protein FimT